MWSWLFGSTNTASSSGSSVIKELREFQQKNQIDKRSERSYPEKVRNKDEFVSYVKSCLEEVDKISGKESQKTCVYKLFDFIAVNRDILEYMPSRLFRDTVRDKMIEFATKEDFYLYWHFKTIFGEDLYKCVPPKKKLVYSLPRKSQ